MLVPYKDSHLEQYPPLVERGGDLEGGCDDGETGRHAFPLVDAKIMGSMPSVRCAVDALTSR